MNKFLFQKYGLSFLLSAFLAGFWVSKEDLRLFFIIFFGMVIAVQEVISYLTDRPMYLMTSQIPGENKCSLERVFSFFLHFLVIVVALVVY